MDFAHGDGLGPFADVDDGAACQQPANVSGRIHMKNGVCPRFNLVQNVRCSALRRCIRDSNCPGSLKCCTNRCGRVCVRPIKIVKDGVCPRFNLVQNVRCSGLRRCIRDNNCPGRLKCCINKCGRVCVQPRNFGEM
uniref:WAP domain-containing protein n=1 Tax=Salarias fasciatus TaxID=181472 RepID=A0A672IU27_SALFA